MDWYLEEPCTPIAPRVGPVAIATVGPGLGTINYLQIFEFLHLFINIICNLEISCIP